MKLEWMGEHRDVVEALIRYCNIYAAAYKAEKMEYGDIRYSFAQIQVLEYLLENEERQENMSAIACRLGITRSNFTKIINRLAAKGLVEKTYLPGNRKELMVSVNQLGKELYEEYAQRILRYHFSPMFHHLQQVPPEYRKRLRDALVSCYLPADQAGREEPDCD